jgi:hypothetical protein
MSGYRCLFYQNSIGGKSKVEEELRKHLLAKAGDRTALRLCFDRIAPPRKDRPVGFELPPIACAADAAKASAALVAAVAVGDLTPSEAAELGKLIESFVRSLEASELESRLARLEQRVPQL